MEFFERPDATERVPITHVVVRESHYPTRILTNDVHLFVCRMIQMGHYPRRSLPREATMSAAVSHYMSEWENGGHDGFIGNSCWDSELLNSIRSGLAALELNALAAVFADLEEFARAEPQRFEASDWTDPTLQALDDRVHALPLDEMWERHAAWLRGLPILRVVPNEDYHAVLTALAEKNLKRGWWQH